MKKLVRKMLLAVLLTAVSGCAMYDYERATVENATSIDNSLILNTLELDVLNNGRDGETRTYQNGDSLQEVTPMNTRIDKYTGKQCRDFHTDSSFRQESKSANKTACRYNEQWHIVSVDGRLTVPSAQNYNGGYGYGRGSAVFGGLNHYVAPSGGYGYGSGGYGYGGFGGGSGFSLYGNGLNIMGGYGQIGGGW